MKLSLISEIYVCHERSGQRISAPDHAFYVCIHHDCVPLLCRKVCNKKDPFTMTAKGQYRDIFGHKKRASTWDALITKKGCGLIPHPRACTLFF